MRDATYMFEAALWCADCIIPHLVERGILSPAARDMDIEDVLMQHREANGWTSESDYDSDEFPKGPFEDGGGEADSPQHCDECDNWLGNPLTGDGAEYVEDAVAEAIVSGRMGVVQQWAKDYGDVLDWERIGRRAFDERCAVQSHA